MGTHLRKILVLHLAFIFALQGCNEDNGEENKPAVERGSFTASITGAVNKEVEGEARYSHSVIETQSAEGSRLQIILNNEENTAEFITLTIMVRDNLEGVDPGTYTVNQSSNEAPFVTIYYTSEENMDYTATNTGTINLAERSEEIAWGSFSAKLVEIQNRTIEISGDFHAEAN